MDRAEAEGGWMERELQAISTDQALSVAIFISIHREDQQKL